MRRTLSLTARSVAVIVAAALMAAVTWASAAQAGTGVQGEVTAGSVPERIQPEAPLVPADAPLAPEVAPDEVAPASSLIRRCGVLWSLPFTGQPYCDLTKEGQRRAFQGATSALAAAICVYSGPLCPVAVVAAGEAQEHVARHGLCSGYLRVTAFPSQTYCV